MYTIMKLEYEAPIYDDFGFETNYKRHVKSVVQINQFSNIKSSVVWTAYNGIKNADETHLVLFSWEIGYLTNCKD